MKANPYCGEFRSVFIQYEKESGVPRPADSSLESCDLRLTDRMLVLPLDDKRQNKSTFPQAAFKKSLSPHGTFFVQYKMRRENV